MVHTRKLPHFIVRRTPPSPNPSWISVKPLAILLSLTIKLPSPEEVRSNKSEGDGQTSGSKSDKRQQGQIFEKLHTRT